MTRDYTIIVQGTFRAAYVVKADSPASAVKAFEDGKGGDAVFVGSHRLCDRRRGRRGAAVTRLAVLREERRVRAAVIRHTQVRPEWHPWARRLEELAAVIHHTRQAVKP